MKNILFIIEKSILKNTKILFFSRNFDVFCSFWWIFMDFHWILEIFTKFLLKIRIFIEKNQKNIHFKIHFLHDNEIFSVLFFCDLEFSYVFDLAHFERPRGCTEVSETKKPKIMQISPGFAWFKKTLLHKK